MSETAYLGTLNSGTRLEHHYGENVHLLSDSWALSALARLGHPDTPLPTVHRLLVACYRNLLHAACEQLPNAVDTCNTRMTATDPNATFSGRIIAPNSRAVVVDIARGGMIPGYLFQTELMDILIPENVRVDHIYMQRQVEPETGTVCGVDFYGSKVGGPVKDTTLFIPDPMGATGASVSHVLDRYTANADDRPRRIVVCHLIVTPEYLRKITTEHPDVTIYAMRLDRGRSPKHVLQTTLGEKWDEERGLDDNDYIIPGAGGLGEVINNAFV